MNNVESRTPPASEDLERRTLIGSVELRAAAEGSKSPGTLVGYAAVFSQLSLDLGMFREKLAPGCFTDSLKTDDVRGLVNHDENMLIGRNVAGTLRMEQDEIGLHYEIDLPNTSVGHDAAENVRLGNMTGCSFSFTTDVDQWDMTGAIPIRTVVKVRKLYDVGPVTYPAYEQTSVACRSFNAALRQREIPPTPPITTLLAKARQRLAEAQLIPNS
ncbi:prohead peptidase. Unknown type peptidase. MEROPS family U35 [Singulisphaera sp. GP187]|uniref:HK97 family phage prohead protease n=1 Tax=Singulisphaera sp. GP187 TaxID=1882752 RepID=UPI00092BB749|nr:HK97 family phage prohead protease [Singulisphaera sp. GP187]SIO60162.1 prohead peptidase. Unknown type peptidase. MEROPS family U35 [Singulisphaera sp. GP187]